MTAARDQRGGDVYCAVCGHVDFAHADRRGCARTGCDCERVSMGSGWLDPARPDQDANDRLRARLEALAAKWDDAATDMHDHARQTDSEADGAMGDVYDEAARDLRAALAGER